MRGEIRWDTSPSVPDASPLISRGVLRLLQCSKAGHVIEVLLPDEVRTASSGRPGGIGDRLPPRFHRAIYSEEVDFLKTAALRKSIHSRERGHCFYCLRRLTPMARCLDHVVPRAVFGGNSYRNLVSCCLQCNSQKGERSAIDFLRRLYRDRRLRAQEVEGRAAEIVAKEPRPRDIDKYLGEPKGSWLLKTLSQLPSMLIARAATVMIVTNEIVLSIIISNLAREVSGKSSVALNAVAVPNARNR